MNTEEIIKKIHEARGKNLHTREDVAFVLTFIAPPGEKRDLKKQVIDSLFTTSSPQGYKTSDDLDSYGEY